jgi:hypothetical protein
MALEEYFEVDTYNEISCEVEPLVSEFDELLKGTKFEVVTHVFGRIKIVTML